MYFSPSPTVPETSHCATTSWTGKKEQVKKNNNRRENKETLRAVKKMFTHSTT